MSIASDLIRGHTDTIILSLLSVGDSYGYKINKDIMELTGNRFEFKEATLYSAFRRLEQSGLIASYWGDENTGARRKYYTITDAGRRQYSDSLAEWDKTRAIVDKLLYAAKNADNNGG
ncbi:MAG: PadR family transcriptional regulator [Oscillospiraceae bacterium]|nr:PadR family transcriptional regulator [Oscillospiraceae bacterium]